LREDEDPIEKTERKIAQARVEMETLDLLSQIQDQNDMRNLVTFDDLLNLTKQENEATTIPQRQQQDLEELHSVVFRNSNDYVKRIEEVDQEDPMEDPMEVKEPTKRLKLAPLDTKAKPARPKKVLQFLVTPKKPSLVDY